MKKREKKRKRPMKVLREREREEIVMLSKRFKERERDHTKGVSIPSTIIHTRALLDLIV